MTTLSETSRAMRGTKRTCPACEVRFYDLAREVIVCPSCGSPYTPALRSVVEAAARTAPLTGKAGWSGKRVKTPGPTPWADPERSVSAEVATGEEQREETESVTEETESATEIVADDEIVLEQEPDDSDVSGLVDPDVEDPEEQ
jgi:uncharacterized protein (TIGR02300 family)